MNAIYSEQSTCVSAPQELTLLLRFEKGQSRIIKPAWGKFLAPEAKARIQALQGLLQSDFAFPLVQDAYGFRAEFLFHQDRRLYTGRPGSRGHPCRLIIHGSGGLPLHLPLRNVSFKCTSSAWHWAEKLVILLNGQRSTPSFDRDGVLEIEITLPRV